MLLVHLELKKRPRRSSRQQFGAKLGTWERKRKKIKGQNKIIIHFFDTLKAIFGPEPREVWRFEEGCPLVDCHGRPAQVGMDKLIELV